MKASLTREQEILRQVKLAKNSHFGVTAIKVEMEGVFGRRGNGGTSNRNCDTCHGGNYIHHAACNGSGRIGEEPSYFDYGQDRRKWCAGCNGCGQMVCPKCFDSLKAWGAELYCQQWFLRQVHEMGLSTRKRDGSYVPKAPLIFARFYYDPSVDSELTFTLSLKKESSIFLLPKILGLWKKLGDEIGRGLSTENAGMHMAFLSDKDCFYPGNDPSDWHECMRNMNRSMQLLMPALFFLGSADSNSRGMRFRIPRVSTEKYSAVHYVKGALEFRVFECCYDNPERVLDNFVVMRNCLRFWSPTYRDTNLHKITRAVKFGNDHDDSLARLYTTAKHIDLLNAGIFKIKPHYYTVRELKQQREFNKNKRTFVNILKRMREDAKRAYPTYKRKKLWEAEMVEQEAIANRMRYTTPPNDETAKEEAFRLIRERAIQEKHEYEQSILEEQAYIEHEVQTKEQHNEGQYSLAV